MLAYLTAALALAFDPVLKRRLQDLEPAFIAYDREEATFVARMNANKAARGEKPTRQSTHKQREIHGYEQDAQTGEAESVRFIKESGDPVQAMRSVLSGVQSDLRFWESSLKCCHPADRCILDERLEVRRRLMAALRDFLSPGSTGNLGAGLRRR